MEPNSLEADKLLISGLGGVTKLAERLNTTVQVVSNWNKRGIPARVKLRHPDLFLRDMQQPRRRASDRAALKMGV